MHNLRDNPKGTPADQLQQNVSSVYFKDYAAKSGTMKPGTRWAGRVHDTRSTDDRA
jgi:hypothetical protein